MPQFCEICAYPDQAAVRAAFAAGGSDREILLPFFGRPRFFGGGSATTFRPKPLAKASLDAPQHIRAPQSGMTVADPI